MPDEQWAASDGMVEWLIKAAVKSGSGRTMERGCRGVAGSGSGERMAAEVKSDWKPIGAERDERSGGGTVDAGSQELECRWNYK